MSNEVLLVEPPITTPTVGKRKGNDDLQEEIGEGAPAKKRPKKSGNAKDANWPEYFQNVNIVVTSLLLCYLTHQNAALQGTSLLFCLTSSGCDKTTQTFKSLNTVIAFCSSRKHLATTFSVIRSSVENIIKRSAHLVIASHSILTSHFQTTRPTRCC